MSKYIIGPGEYNCWMIKPTDQQVYDLSGGIPSKLAGQPAAATDVKGCLHHAALIDEGGNVWTWGDNTNGIAGNGTTSPSTSPIPPTQVLTDAGGNPFTNIVQVLPYANGGAPNGLGWGILALKADGTVWIWGNTQNGFSGDETGGSQAQTRPVQVPGLQNIVEINAMLVCSAKDNAGQIWVWGGAYGQYTAPYELAEGSATANPSIPTKLAQAEPAIAMAAGGNFNYFIGASGSLYGWGYYPQYFGIANGTLTPVKLDAVLGLPAKVAKIWISSIATYAILADGTAWSWGDNVCGACGNGIEPDYSKTSPPYTMSWNIDTVPQKPVQILVGLQIVAFHTGLGDAFYAYAEDINGNLYSCGRNKGGVLGNGVIGLSSQEVASLPNSWDVPWFTPVNPFALTAAIPTRSPASPTLAAAVIPGQVSAGAAQTITGTSAQLTGSATGAPINYWIWSQVSGPNQALIILVSSQNPQVTGLIPGTYVFQLIGTDNNWNKSVSTVTITVAAAAAPPPPATPRTVTTLTVNIDGSWVVIPISDAKFVFSDGGTQ